MFGSEFLLGFYDRKKALHIFAWHKICHLREIGDLSIQDLRGMHLALLEKLIWNLGHNPSSLDNQILHYKYRG